VLLFVFAFVCSFVYTFVIPKVQQKFSFARKSATKVVFCDIFLICLCMSDIYDLIREKIEKDEIRMKTELCPAISMTYTGFKKMMDNKTMTVDCLYRISNFFNVDITFWFGKVENSSLNNLSEPEAIYQKQCEHCRDKDNTIKALNDHIDTLKFTIELCKRGNLAANKESVDQTSRVSKT
jgi:hypothetical protein